MGSGGDEKTQRDRIAKILTELAPNAGVKFDPNSAGIRFRVIDEPTGTVLMPFSSEWDANELTAKSDDWIRKAIGALSGGRIGVRAFQTGDAYQACHGEYDILVKARDDGWYWSVIDRNTGQVFDSPRREIEVEEAKKAAVLSVGTLTGEMTLGNRVTLGDLYNKIQWVES